MDLFASLYADRSDPAMICSVGNMLSLGGWSCEAHQHVSNKKVIDGGLKVNVKAKKAETSRAMPLPEGSPPDSDDDEYPLAQMLASVLIEETGDASEATYAHLPPALLKELHEQSTWQDTRNVS